jgi:hypothetical protein
MKIEKINIGLPIVFLLSLTSCTTTVEEPAPLPESTFNYPSTPVSVGQRLSSYISNQIVLADIDKNDSLDVVISNGIDLVSQDNMILYNPFNGVVNTNLVTPDWLSSPSQINFGIAMGDVNLDGKVDLAASLSKGRYGGPNSGGAQLFTALTPGADSLASWQSDDKYGAFGITLADIDADGDLDLITSAQPKEVDGQTIGDGYARIYLNDNGSLQTEPSWKTPLNATAVIAADINMDGWMDLAFSGTNVSIFYGKEVDPNMLPYTSTADWVSAETFDFSFSIDTGQFASYDTLGLAVSFGCDLSVTDLTCDDSGYLLYQPSNSKNALWRSDDGYVSSGLLLADLNGDQMLDLVGATWTGPSRDEKREHDSARAIGGPLLIYKGLSSGLFETSPSYTSKVKGFLENIACTDIDNSAVKSIEESFDLDKKRAVFTLPNRNIEKLVSVKVNGQVIYEPGQSTNNDMPQTKQWLTTNGMNWVSISPVPNAGDKVEINYLHSGSKDLLVTDANPSSALLYVLYSGN